MSQASRGIALGIEVDQQGALVGLGQTDGQVHRSGGLADPTFLIGNAKNSAQRDKSPYVDASISPF